MKGFFKCIFISFLVVLAVPALAQPQFSMDIPSGGYDAIFASLAAIVAVIPMVVGLVKGIFPKMPSVVKQIISWVVGVAIALFGWWQGLGFFQDMEWYIALLYGLGSGLAANGIADIGFVDWLIGLFRKKKD